MRLPRLLLAPLGLFSGALAALAGAHAWSLSRMPFNEAGRSFDPVSGVVYHQGAALGWSVVATSAFAIFILVAMGWRQSRSGDRSHRSSRSNTARSAPGRPETQSSISARTP